MNPVFKKEILRELFTLIDKQHTILMEVDETEFSKKPFPGRWSKKEIVGHLIDSAYNNIQRFVRAQYELDSSIRYDQDTWVRLNAYQETPLSDLIALWLSLNQHIIRIIEIMPTENFKKTSQVGDQVYSLSWLMEDYVRHMKHHLAQINNS